MNTKADISNTLIIKEFEELSNLILTQLDTLNNIFNEYIDDVPDDVLKTLNKNEKEIDKYEVKLDDMIVQAIVLYKPVASELRQLFAIYRMVINLERIGDHVIKITNFISEIKEPELLRKMRSTLQPMLKLSIKMVRKALISFTNNDKEFALWTIKKDMLVDEFNQKLIKKAIKKSDLPKDYQSLLSSITDIKSIISSFERIGDQATNIAEISIYASSGKDVRHKKITK